MNTASGYPVRGPYQVVQVQLRPATPTLPVGTSITLTLNSSVSVAGSTSDSCPSTGGELQRTSLHRLPEGQAQPASPQIYIHLKLYQSMFREQPCAVFEFL